MLGRHTEPLPYIKCSIVRTLDVQLVDYAFFVRQKMPLLKVALEHAELFTTENLRISRAGCATP